MEARERRLERAPRLAIDVEPRERVRFFTALLNERNGRLRHDDVGVGEHEVLMPAALGQVGERPHHVGGDWLTPAAAAADAARVEVKIADRPNPRPPRRRRVPLQIDDFDSFQPAQRVHGLRLTPLAVAVCGVELRADEDAHTSSSGSMAMYGCDARLTTIVRPKATSTAAAARPT